MSADKEKYLNKEFFVLNQRLSAQICGKSFLFLIRVHSREFAADALRPLRPLWWISGFVMRLPAGSSRP